MDKGAWQAIVHGVAKSQPRRSDDHRSLTHPVLASVEERLYALLIVMHTATVTVANCTKVPQKLKIELASPSEILYYYLAEENEETNLKWYLHPFSNCSITYNSQDVKTTQVPTQR